MKLALLVALLPLAAFANEHIVIHAPPGSTQTGREVKQKQIVSLPAAGGQTVQVQGTISRFAWRNSKGKSIGEVADFYERELSRAGFQTLTSCSGKECGALGLAAFGKLPKDPDAHYSLGQLKRRELGDAYAALHVGGAQATLLLIDQAATPEQTEASAKEAVAVAQRMTAASIGEALDKEGHVELGDILYRPGEVALRPEAQGIVQQIAALLKSDAGLKLYVVGHTDGQGEFSQNLAVSKKRASWLVKELAKQGIVSSRVRADGVGPLAPIATNQTEAGRSKNRRVELVRQ